MVDVPNLANHSLAISRLPATNPSGEYSLLGYGDRVSIKRDGTMSGHKGRLFFRYIAKS